MGDAGEALAPPTTAQTTGPGPIFTVEFALSIPISPRISPAASLE